MLQETPDLKAPPDPAMFNSAFERVANDAYHTIDERCVAHLSKVWPLAGRRFVEPCAGLGYMVHQLESHGASLIFASDLVAHDGADQRIISGLDVFVNPVLPTLFPGDCIISNLPFADQRPMIRHLLSVAPQCWLVLLMRSAQLHVADMRPLLQGNRFFGAAPIPFRVRWHHESKHTPRHEHAWLLWRPASMDPQPPVLLL